MNSTVFVKKQWPQATTTTTLLLAFLLQLNEFTAAAETVHSPITRTRKRYRKRIDFLWNTVSLNG